MFKSDKSVRMSDLVKPDGFPAWIQNHLDIWTQYPFDKQDDPVMLEHIATVFENPQHFSAEVIYRFALRGGRLLERFGERTNTSGHTPQRIYEMYQKAFHAIQNCQEKDHMLTESLSTLLHEQDIFAKKQISPFSQNVPESEFDLNVSKERAETILHNPQSFSPETIFTTTLEYAALQTWGYKAQEVPARVLHAYRKGLNALAGAKTKDRDYLLFLTKLFSNQSIFVQQQALHPIGRINENAYQRRDTVLKPLEKPPKPSSIITEYYEDTLSRKNDRVTVMLFKKVSGKEHMPLSLDGFIYIQQRHPNPDPEKHTEWFEDWYAYDWEGVGGGITKILSAMKTAQVEVQEETSLSEVELSYFGTIPKEFDERKRQNWIYSGFVTDDNIIETSKEHIQYRWITVKEALKRSLARDHEAILKKMCSEMGDEEVKLFVKSLL